MISVQFHENVVSLCDSELIGKTFEKRNKYKSCRKENYCNRTRRRIYSEKRYNPYSRSSPCPNLRILITLNILKQLFSFVLIIKKFLSLLKSRFKIKIIRNILFLKLKN